VRYGLHKSITSSTYGFAVFLRDVVGWVMVVL
jgi:hypothetical protein